VASGLKSSGRDRARRLASLDRGGSSACLLLRVAIHHCIEAYDELDVRFHVALVRASRNEAMHLAMLAVRDAVARHLLDALRVSADPGATLERLTAEHEEILAALSAGDGDRAATLVERHIWRFYEEQLGANG
jgi:DNA-binding GntR family transcriptional regulator